MKGPLDRTKVVLRHLPPTISQSNLTEQVDSRFLGRYHWLVFRPGKQSSKHVTYSRAYIDFNKPEDVIEFAEYFNGHVFVNEKGTQFKTIVEYAPSQRVPKQWSKKDGRVGTILKDPEYLEFLELLAKPVENLPSAEIQLERKEAERAGAPRDDPVVTPLMDYIRQKRAAKGEARRTVVNGKPTRKVSGTSSRSPLSGSSKRGLEKRRTSSTMYVLKESSKIVSSNDKPTYLLVHKHDQQPMGKSVDAAAVSGNEAFEGGPGSSGSGKKKILLLKGKEKEIPSIPDGSSTQQNVASPAKPSHSSGPLRQNQRREASGRIIRNILVNTRQPSSGSQISNQERDRKPPRHPSLQSSQTDTNGIPDDNKVISKNLNATPSDKQERRTRNRDRPDRGVWAPLRHSDGSHASDESLSSASQTSQVVDSAEGTNVEAKHDMMVNRGGRGSHYSAENGSHRQGGRRGSGYNLKDSDGPSIVEGKPSKKGGFSGYGSHEKQVWVQKSSSGT
ncbi:Regulator of nonsense transcripts UPF3 [Striga hermonthica]|uniref:Regulator of nonsense transcripts UPF3 n=1 Tax=Striga hermonthica TaxID=68872 RepID=A0A9N7REU0_STRHE|nr:Regulator of nonsense transcripts UPF3 [Striga hermonthica]